MFWRASLRRYSYVHAHSSVSIERVESLSKKPAIEDLIERSALTQSLFRLKKEFKVVSFLTK